MQIDKSISEYWDNRYQKGGNSGGGSNGDELWFKLKEISTLNLTEVNTILDIGCGDMSLGGRIIGMIPWANYRGLDISLNLISELKKKYINSQKNVYFDVIDGTDFKYKGDLVLCIDVLFHQLDSKMYRAMIEKIKNSYNKYLVLTEYNHNPNNPNFDNWLRYRKFNPKLIGDNYVEIKIPYRSGDKILYIYKKI